MNPIGLLLVFAGLFSVAGGVCNWEWFMTHRKARFMTAILTRTGARIFYIALGAFITVMGIVVTLGIVE